MPPKRWPEAGWERWTSSTPTGWLSAISTARFLHCKVRSECRKRRRRRSGSGRLRPIVSSGCTIAFFLPGKAEEFPFSEWDYVVDAIDTLAGKIGIVKACARAGVPVISSMGAGNKLDPTAFVVSDIYRTKTCPLARAMRRLCRENGIEKLKVVYSKEVPVSLTNAPLREGGACGSRVPGSVAFVPSVAGLIAAGEVVRDLTSVRGNGIDRS